jgi:hypothetical protein
LVWWKKKRRGKPWGIVYDVDTKKPIPFATARIYDEVNKKLIKETVTDLDGKYGFVLDQGTYQLVVEHGEYIDVEETVEVKNKEEAVGRDIGLEEVKGRDGRKKMGKSMKDKLRDKLYTINSIIMVIGLILSVIAVIVTPVTYNYAVVGVYVVQLLILWLVKDKRNWWYVYDSMNMKGVGGAFVRVYDQGEGRQIEVMISDEKGRARLKLPRKDYLVFVNCEGYRFPSERDSGRVYKNAGGIEFIKVDKDKSPEKISIGLDR